MSEKEKDEISEKELLALQVLPEYSWEMENYIQGVLHKCGSPALTMYAAENMFQLDPPPPELDASGNINVYVIEALKQKNLDYFSFFLHKNEKYLNRFIRRTLAGDGDIRYDPEQFMDIKLSCAVTLLHLLPSYDPSKGAAFRTYAYRYVQNAVRQYQRRKESWSFKSLSQYKKIRTAAWMQKNLLNAAERFAKDYKCDLAAAEKYLAEAKAVHNRDSLFVRTEEGGETLEEIQEGVSYDYVEILTFGIHAKAVREAFDRLPAEEQYYLEQRNAICMECGKAEPLKKRLTFDELGEKFEFTTANGAEKAYHRAVEHLALLMAEGNAIRVVTIKRKSVTRRKKKIAAATYEYHADGDGEWGDIQFDFETGTAEITYIAELDTTQSHVYAEKAMEVIFEAAKTELPKERLIAFPRY